MDSKKEKKQLKNVEKVLKRFGFDDIDDDYTQIWGKNEAIAEVEMEGKGYYYFMDMTLKRESGKKSWRKLSNLSYEMDLYEGSDDHDSSHKDYDGRYNHYDDILVDWEFSNPKKAMKSLSKEIDNGNFESANYRMLQGYVSEFNDYIEDFNGIRDAMMVINDDYFY